MTDPSDPSAPTGPSPDRAFAGREVEVDLAAFLPEGTSIGEHPAAEGPEGFADAEHAEERVAPGPADALGSVGSDPADRDPDLDPVADTDEADEADPPGDENEAAAPGGSGTARSAAGEVGEVVTDGAAPIAEERSSEEPAAPPARPAAVDVAVLTRIEGELAEVDEALLAIDAGDPGRSPLLVRLLADDARPQPDRPGLGDGAGGP